jgi:hypothetical protein
MMNAASKALESRRCIMAQTVTFTATVTLTKATLGWYRVFGIADSTLHLEDHPSL